jgi:integrase
MSRCAVNAECSFLALPTARYPAWLRGICPCLRPCQRGVTRVAEYARQWLDQQTQLRPKTRQWYDVAIRVHVAPSLGRLRLSTLTPDDVSRLIRLMGEAGYRPWTVRGVLVPLSRMLEHAQRRGLIASNAVKLLERGERPAVGQGEKRILDSNEIARLLDVTPERYRPIVTLCVFTGLRQGEALGLTWADVDLDGARLHVRKQLDRSRARVEPKTASAKRSVVLMPSLVRLLRERKEAAFAIGRAGPDAFVFASETGGPMHYRNVVRRGLDKAIETAGLDLDGKPKLHWHSLRDTAASLMITEGLPVTYVSRQLGHADPSITLRIYARLFDAAEHAQRASDRLEASFGSLLAGRSEGKTEERNAGEQRRMGVLQYAPEPAHVSQIGTGGN